MDSCGKLRVGGPAGAVFCEMIGLGGDGSKLAGFQDERGQTDRYEIHRWKRRAFVECGRSTNLENCKQ